MIDDCIRQLPDGRYVIKNGSHPRYGVFPKLAQAKEFKQICIQHNWNDEILEKCHLQYQIDTYYPNKYITSQNNKWIIQKTVNGKVKSFGSFSDLDEARKHRDKCLQSDWDESLRLINYNRRKKVVGEKYISYVNGKFLVQKNIDGHFERFDLCHTLDEAIECRNFWVDCDWDWDCINLC